MGRDRGPGAWGGKRPREWGSAIVPPVELDLALRISSSCGLGDNHEARKQEGAMLSGHLFDDVHAVRKVVLPKYRLRGGAKLSEGAHVKNAAICKPYLQDSALRASSMLVARSCALAMSMQNVRVCVCVCVCVGGCIWIFSYLDALVAHQDINFLLHFRDFTLQSKICSIRRP